MRGAKGGWPIQLFDNLSDIYYNGEMKVDNKKKVINKKIMNSKLNRNLNSKVNTKPSRTKSTASVAVKSNRYETSFNNKVILDNVEGGRIKDVRNLKTITVREFARNMSKYLLQVSLSGQSFSVTKNGTPLAELNPTMRVESKKENTIQDIMNLKFKGRESKKELARDLNERIDEMIYGR